MTCLDNQVVDAQMYNTAWGTSVQPKFWKKLLLESENALNWGLSWCSGAAIPAEGISVCKINSTLYT